MTYDEVLERARKVLAPRCRVCRDCNGVACRGEVPGVGALGNGSGFTDCRKYLDEVRLHLDAVHEHFEPDTSAALFGRTYAAPIMVAPIGGMPINYTGAMTETEYSHAVVDGALDAGILAFTGDGPLDDYFPSTLPVIRQAHGQAVPTIKPWAREKVLSRLADIAPLGCPAFAMDVDSAAHVNLRMLGKPAYAQPGEALAEYARIAGIPFIVKGVMTPDSAERCAEAGAYGVVVSTHGGRCIPDTPPPISVLPAIRRRVGSRMKVFVDGGIRSGADVFKCLALGADAVLIGRPYAVAAHGGRAEGVSLLTRKLIGELRTAMLVTDCRTLADITPAKVWDRNQPAAF